MFLPHFYMKAEHNSTTGILYVSFSTISNFIHDDLLIYL